MAVCVFCVGRKLAGYPLKWTALWKTSWPTWKSTRKALYLTPLKLTHWRDTTSWSRRHLSLTTNIPHTPWRFVHKYIFSICSWSVLHIHVPLEWSFSHSSSSLCPFLFSAAPPCQLGAAADHHCQNYQRGREPDPNAWRKGHQPGAALRVSQFLQPLWQGQGFELCIYFFHNYFVITV